MKINRPYKIHAYSNILCIGHHLSQSAFVGSSRLQMFCKINVLKNSAKFTKKHPWWSLFNKIEILKNIFYVEHLQKAALIFSILTRPIIMTDVWSVIRNSLVAIIIETEQRYISLSQINLIFITYTNINSLKL